MKDTRVSVYVKDYDETGPSTLGLRRARPSLRQDFGGYGRSAHVKNYKNLCYHLVPHSDHSELTGIAYKSLPNEST
jgi:hypothetical protein